MSEKQQARLENWRVSEGHDFRTRRHLEGLAYGHPDSPRIMEGEPVCTSPLVVLNEAEGWAETRNTIYRLGTKANATGANPVAETPEETETEALAEVVVSGGRVFSRPVAETGALEPDGWRARWVRLCELAGGDTLNAALDGWGAKTLATMALIEQSIPAIVRRAPSGEPEGGVARIAAERRRQVESEGWSQDHDVSEHGDGALAVCASIYAMPPSRRGPIVLGRPTDWPSNCCDYKPGDRIRELEKAGALIAAEIDRLLRRLPTPPRAPQEAE